MSGVGTQLKAPEGFASIPKGERVYFVRNSTHSGTVLLCWFLQHGAQWRVHLIKLEQRAFDAAIEGDSPQITRAEFQASLPPWLLEVEGINFDEIENTRIDPKRTYRDLVRTRHAHVAALIENAEAILSSSDPLAEISRRGSKLAPNQHPHRLQIWFFAYLLHGRNIWALMPATHKIGRWDRSSTKHRSKKYGRKGYKNGRAYGYSIHQMRERVEAAYLRHCGLKRTMRAIHRQALVSDFNCKLVKRSRGEYQVIQPSGEPFPSYGQFRRAIIEKFGEEAVQRTRWGSARFRSKVAPDIGSFSSPYANLLESLIVDAFYVKDRPRDLLSDQPNGRLCVFRGVCGTSANRCGVGFAFENEKMRGYSEMLFSMAIPKSKLGKIYGVPIDDEEWTSVGLPPAFLSDRGPGASQKLIKDWGKRFPVKELAPSNSGQSKALGESTHSRDDHLEGEPVHVTSHLNSMEMVRQHVLLTKAENHRTNIAPRLTPTMVEDFRRDGMLPTAFHLWNYLDDRYRTNAASISFEQAVRTFLLPIKMIAQSDGLWIHGQKYDSPELRATKLIGKVARGQPVEVDGYMLTMAVRYAWVEVEGMLVEVEAQLLIRDDKEQLYMSLSQLEARGRDRKVLNADQRDYADAAMVGVINEFKESTQKDWVGGTVRGGPVKKQRGLGAIEAAVHRARGAEGAV